MKQRSIIALLTDFGTGDGYVAVMKGVIGRIAPEANVIDISHQVIPQAIDQAAFLLWSAYRYFPRRTIFVCVVDPGVGSRRAILCAEIAGCFFIAPDNGILKYVLAHERLGRCVRVSDPRFMERHVSATFHGRDIFASVAGFLATGTPMARLGPVARPRVGVEQFAHPIPHRGRPLNAKVLHIDHFGNCITNILLPKERKLSLSVTIGRKTISRVADHYGEAEPKRPFLLEGSTGLLEISIRNGNAAKVLRAKPGVKLRVRILARMKGSRSR